MKIAVLMSTYNGEKYIKKQIDSILAQVGDFKLDLWVRDDCSTDNTKKILEVYEASGKLKWYSGKNLGPAHSFLDLVKQCRGYDYYAFADQDDYWMPDKINIAVNHLLEKKRPSLYFANAELVDFQLESLGRNVYKASPKLDFETIVCAGGILGCTTVFNKELASLVQNTEIPDKIVMHDFFLDVLCAAVGGNLFCDLHPQMKYRQHGTNVVGVANGKINTIISRVGDITTKQKVSIAEQAEEILNLYGSEINQQNKIWLSKVANYKKNVISRALLACSMKTKYMNKNMGLKLRLSILLGSR